MTDAQLLTRRWPERRLTVLAAAAATFVAVAVAHRANGDPAVALGLLYVLPVMLVALELGLVGGCVAAGLAIAFVATAGSEALDALGVATRSVSFVAVGVIAGRFSDRMRAAHAREERLLGSGLELGESGPYERLPRAVAEAALRTPRAHGASVQVDGVAAEAGRMDGRHTVTSIRVRGEIVGRIVVAHGGRLAHEDLAALQLLALQAGLAADNQRLLTQEREAATVEMELLRVRDDLLEQRSGLGRLLDAQEDERRRVAETLHEDLAQVLAAVLLGLRILGRTAPESSGVSLEDLHAQVVGVLADVREVARSLLPTSLTQLGLVPALEVLADDLRDRHHGGLEIDADAVPDPLPEPLRTGAYRLVEQAMTAHVGDGAAHLRLSVDAGELAITLALEVDDAAEPLAAARARAALLGGTLEVERSAAGSARMRVRLPLPGSPADRRGQLLTGSAQ
jgi:signal transduction histidine kinase